MRLRPAPLVLSACLVVEVSLAEPAADGSEPRGDESATSEPVELLPAPRKRRDHRIASGLGLAGAYAALGTWMWFAWYKDEPRLPSYRFGGDGWFGDTTYAGGADKLGHFWSNLMLSRLGTELLRSGGWGPLSSSLMGAGLCFGAFVFVEVNDGYYTEFSPSDMTANALGALTAVAMSNWPALDDAIDFRVQWFPSAGFRHSPSPDFAEDYSGQTYLLAYKPRSIRAIRQARSPLMLLGFVNPVLGFESRNYKPPPPPGDSARRQQNGFVGVSLDMQAVIDATLGGRSSTGLRVTHTIGHALFEGFNLPFSTLPVVTVAHLSTEPTR